MDVQRDLVVQVGVSTAVVLLFVVGLAVLTGAFGASETVENRTLNGTVNGTFDGTVGDERVNGTFEGTFNNGFEAPVEGSVNGTLDNDTLTAEFNGTIEMAIDGTVQGTVTNGTVDNESDSLDAEFDGTANGTTATTLDETGGLVLIGLIGVFIVTMSVSGYIIERFKDEE